MALTISVIKENADDETRVAATPDTVKKLVALGATVLVEPGAGATASIPDDAYTAAGAKITATATYDCDVILCVQRPSDAALGSMREGTTIIGMLGPYTFKPDAYAKKKASAISLELVPRITRAQSMDVLSSQANLAGYRAVVEATNVYSRAFPMMMTAAGTIAPAKVFVMGAGVAGLQAIATARRLGAVVSATDVRAASREQVMSLGASFVMVENEETKQAETAGGYAKEMSEDYKRQQAALVAETIKKQDIVITTALIPGRPAPILITEDMVKSMKPGSVIVDMATEQGGNCPLSEKGKVVVKHGVTIIGYNNLPARIALDASNLYARNVYNVVALMLNKDKTDLNFNFEDEIIKGFTLVHGGVPVHTILTGIKQPTAAPKVEAPSSDAKSSFKRNPAAATAAQEEGK